MDTKATYHPHLHCIVPAGGLNANGNWKDKNGKFLFSVKAMSAVFKNKFIDGLKGLYDQGVLFHKYPIDSNAFTFLVNKLHQQKWVVNSKPGFTGRLSVLEYLERYMGTLSQNNDQ